MLRRCRRLISEADIVNYNLLMKSKFLEKLWCCVGVGDSFFKQISSIKIYLQSEYVSGETVVLRRCRRLVFEADIVNWGLYIK